MNFKISLGLSKSVVVLCVTAATALVAVPASLTPLAVTATDTPVLYEGRFAFDATGAVRLGFPGVTAHLHFRGNLLTMRATASDDDLFFDVIVDDGAPSLLRLHKGANDCTVFKGDRVAEHVLTLTRRNESWQGTIAIQGYALNAGGTWLAAPELPKRKLMFIGDSVTSGELTAYKTGDDPKAKVNSNARISYGMILARRLNAQCHLVSYGGRGVIRDWQGIRDTRNAPQFYELALPDDPAARWDPSRYIPDAVGIQLGTNDFSQGVPDQNEFVNAYVQFIEKIRRDAPEAVIFLMDSPILNDDSVRGPKHSMLHAYLEQIAAQAGSPKVILAPLSHYPGVPNNGHPTGAEHEAMATELEPVIRRALAW